MKGSEVGEGKPKVNFFFSAGTRVTAVCLCVCFVFCEYRFVDAVCCLCFINRCCVGCVLVACRRCVGCVLVVCVGRALVVCLLVDWLLRWLLHGRVLIAFLFYVACVSIVMLGVCWLCDGCGVGFGLAVYAGCFAGVSGLC